MEILSKDNHFQVEAENSDYATGVRISQTRR
jgi:hypothetical protein